jgi:catechol 2,3-dioxygenase
MDKPVTPRGINHLVLNVRDIEESHSFWTEVVGFRQVGQLTPTKERPNPPKMRFYSGVREDGTSHHHDVAQAARKLVDVRHAVCREPYRHHHAVA